MKRTLLAIPVVLLAASVWIFSRSERTALRVHVLGASGRAREGIAISFWWRLVGSSEVVRKAAGCTSDAQGMALVPEFRRTRSAE